MSSAFEARLARLEPVPFVTQEGLPTDGLEIRTKPGVVTIAGRPVAAGDYVTLGLMVATFESYRVLCCLSDLLREFHVAARERNNPEQISALLNELLAGAQPAASRAIDEVQAAFALKDALPTPRGVQ